MQIPYVAVVDQSRMFRGARSSVLDQIVRAIETQVERDFAPAWQRTAVPVLLVGYGQTVPDDAGIIYLVDKIDQVRGAVGFHQADPRGFFAGYVAVESIARLGGTMTSGPDSVSATLSHEVLELLANPAVNLWADAPGGRSFAHEVCDPVSGDCYEIEVDPVSGGNPSQIAVSNFVLPDWFFPWAENGSCFDFMRLLNKPFECRTNGYVTVYELGSERGVYGASVPPSKQATREQFGRCARARTAIG